MISDHVEWWCDVRFFMVRIPEKSIQELEVGPHGVGNFQRFEGWKPTLKTSAWTWNRPLCTKKSEGGWVLLLFIEGISWPLEMLRIFAAQIFEDLRAEDLRHFSGPFTRWGFLPEYGWAPLKDTRSLQSPDTFESLFEHWDNWWGAPGYYEFGVYKCKADLR